MKDRTAQRATSTIERRPPATTAVQRGAPAVSSSPARTLQQRLGNQASQALVTRVLPAVQAGRSTAQPPSLGFPERQAGPSPTQVKTAEVVTAKGAPAGPASKVSPPTATQRLM